MLKFLIATFFVVPQAFASIDDKCERVKTVLITAFEEFGGSKDNGSVLVAGKLSQMKSEDTCIHYQTCVIPVEYQRGYEQALKCYEVYNPKPDAIIAMGEAGCTLRVETQARNLNNAPGTPDNGGVERINEPIEPGAPFSELLTMPTAAMLCATDLPRSTPSEGSVSAGGYVCNDVAFRFARYLKPKQVPFTFIHVPNSRCEQRPAVTAKKVNDMIGVALWHLNQTDTVYRDKLGSHPYPKSAKRLTSACIQEQRTRLRLEDEWGRRSRRR